MPNEQLRLLLLQHSQNLSIQLHISFLNDTSLCHLYTNDNLVNCIAVLINHRIHLPCFTVPFSQLCCCQLMVGSMIVMLLCTYLVGLCLHCLVLNVYILHLGSVTWLVMTFTIIDQSLLKGKF